MSNYSIYAFLHRKKAIFETLIFQPVTLITTINRKNLLIYNGLLLAMVIVLFFANYYSKTLFFPPCANHQWRQADCLSIAKNYYEEGMHFFQPKIHYQGPEEGKAVSELPILNYTAASLWKVFGEHEFIYRLMEYLLYILSIFVLFNTIGVYLGSWLLAFFSVSILLTSPLLTYYSLNFLADVPALSISIIALCLFYRFYHNQRNYLFYLALILGTLAVLMKASALIPLCLIYLFSVLDITNLNRIVKTKALFTGKWLPLTMLAASLLTIVLWYRWALAYNYDDTNNIFLLTILPIWDMEEADILAVFKVLVGDLFPVFLSKPMLTLLFILVFYVLARFKNLSNFFRIAFLLSFGYFIIYILFFFKVFSVHDYYLTNLMIFPVITFMSAIELLRKSDFHRTNKVFLVLFLIFSFALNTLNAAGQYRLKMIDKDNMIKWNPFVHKEDIKGAEYLFWDYSRSIKKIESFRPVLKSHGIKRDEKVVVVPDQSFNIALYFLDQKGYGIARDHFEHDSLIIDHFRKKNVKYFIMMDTTMKQLPAYRQFKPFVKPFFISNGVEVMKLNSDF